MEANPYYFRGLPKLRKIVYKIITDDNTLFTQLQTGELGMWSTVSSTFVERIGKVPTLRTILVPSQYISAIYLNTQGPVLRERDIRLALRLGTDRAFLLRTIFHSAGTAAESVVPRISQDFDAAIGPAPYDPAAAERLLDGAGWKRGSDGMRAKAGVPLALNVALPSGYAPSANAAELVRAMWTKLGIDVEVKPYQSEQFFGPASTGGILMSGKFDASFLSLPGEYFADETAYYGCRYAPPKGFNVTRYCNRALDAAMDAYAGSYDARERGRLASRIQRQIDADAPAIVLYERSFAYSFTTRLTGFTPNGFTPFDDFLDVDIEP
jgi:peptide/nickel transport system substrate-binding protein